MIDSERKVSDRPGNGEEDTIAAIEREVAFLLRRAESAQTGKSDTERLVRSAYLLLSELEAHGAVGIAALADTMQVDVSTASRQITPLERQGFVSRRPDPVDGRVSLIEITPLGLDRLSTTRDQRHRTYTTLLHDWPDQDRAALAHYLARLNESIVRHGHDAQASRSQSPA